MRLDSRTVFVIGGCLVIAVFLAGCLIAGAVMPGTAKDPTPSPGTSQAGIPAGSRAYNSTILLDVPLPASPATVPSYRVVSVQKFSTGTGTALTIKKHIPSVAEAPELAEKALEPYGGLPAGAVLERTEQVFMKKYNLTTGMVEETYPQYTRVEWRQYVNGSPVLGSGIEVSLGENGELLDISKDWSTLEYRGEIPVISAGEAFEKLQARELLIPVQSSLNGHHITRVQAGYSVRSHRSGYPAQEPVPDQCIPVWIFYGERPDIPDDQPFPLLINATRG
jgi:hypothetical protein